MAEVSLSWSVTKSGFAIKAVDRDVVILHLYSQHRDELLCSPLVGEGHSQAIIAIGTEPLLRVKKVVEYCLRGRTARRSPR